MLGMNAKLKFSKRMLLKLLILSVTFLGSQLTPEVLAAQNDFSGPGPFSVSVSTAEGQGLLFTPSNSDQKKRTGLQWSLLMDYVVLRKSIQTHCLV